MPGASELLLEEGERAASIAPGTYTLLKDTTVRLGLGCLSDWVDCVGRKARVKLVYTAISRRVDGMDCLHARVEYDKHARRYSGGCPLALVV